MRALVYPFAALLLCASIVQAAKPPGAALFEDSRITRVKIEISPEDIAELKSEKLNASKQRRKVKATVREGDRVYRDVALHLKGSFGSFRGIDDKAAFTLDFDDTREDQRFHGLKKIHLNNSVQDPGYVSERLSREL